MRQLTLTGSGPARPRFETHITRRGDTLEIPEGLATIPCTHGIHRFPGKFIPNIPRYIIREVLPHDESRTILDPFCGSGTTLVEAALERRKFVGADLDPLSVLISRAKVTALSKDDLSQIRRTLSHLDFSTPHPESIPRLPTLSHWFGETQVRQLSAIKNGCLTLPHPARDFGLVVFSSILRRVSNADDQTQKTYVSHTLRKRPPLPQVLFPVFLQRALAGMEEYVHSLTQPPTGRVLLADARELPGDLTFNDVVTSPPYIDSMEYVYNQMLEYVWLAPELGLESLKGLRKVQERFMGFREEQRADGAHFRGLDLPTQRVRELESVCGHIERVSPREASRVRSYFQDYARHVECVRGRQSQGDWYSTVIGNSVIRGVTVPTVDTLVSIHESRGYRLVDRFDYEIRRHYMKFPRRSNSGKILRDNILMFRAS